MNTFARLSSTLVLATFALPSAAQGISAPDVAAKSDKSDWYKQYAQSRPVEARPVWQAEPDDDFSVVISNGHRWSLSFDKLSRPAVSPLPREQVQAGASFKITPRFSVGGEVSVGADELSRLEDENGWKKDDVEAGIRLKSAFKF
jgi:hypothetical protein